MAETERWQSLPTQLELAEFDQFVLPHLSIGSRGPAPKLSLYKIFNYVLKILYLGCQWKELPICKDGEGHPETHYTRRFDPRPLPATGGISFRRAQPRSRLPM
jgi:hypothetical protein